jgi:hypothetical protein
MNIGTLGRILEVEDEDLLITVHSFEQDSYMKDTVTLLA